MKKTERWIAAKYFGWWFAWGAFTGVLILIPIGGGGFAFSTQIFVILMLGVLSGLGGLFYAIKRGVPKIGLKSDY